MAQGLGNKKIVIAIIIAAILLVVATIVIIVQQVNRDNTEQTVETSQQTEKEVEQEEVAKSEAEKDAEKETTTPATALDPSTVSTIDIQPLELTVSYVKGVPGFEYQILRTAQGTKYAELTNEDLKGTKCTDDTGVFASIIVNPGEAEAPTLDAKTVVDGVTYGLSLASNTCTNNQELLDKFQSSFSSAFPLLKKMAPADS